MLAIANYWVKPIHPNILNEQACEIVQWALSHQFKLKLHLHQRFSSGIGNSASSELLSDKSRIILRV